MAEATLAKASCPTCKRALIPLGTSFFCLRCDARFTENLELEPKERSEFEGN